MRLACALLLVLAPLTFISCRPHSTSGISLDRDSARFVSPDTTVIAAIDFDRLKASPFYQAHQSLLALPALNQASQPLGVDPRRDLSTGVLTWNGRDPLLILRGRFSRARLEQALDSPAPARSYHRIPLYGEAHNVVALVADGLVLGGTEPSVQQGIDARQRAFATLPAEFTQSLAWLPSTAQIWIASRGTLPFADVPTRSDYASLLANFAGYIKATALGLTADAGLHLRARVDCVSDVGAKRVNDALRGGIGLARLSTKDNQLDLLRLYDAIHVRQQQQTVFVEADLSSAEANQLLQLLPATNATSHPH